MYEIESNNASNCRFPNNCELDQQADQISKAAEKSVRRLGEPLSQQARTVICHVICLKCRELVNTAVDLVR